MPIDFPNSPTVGQVYTYQGKSWIWNGSAWDVPRALNELGAIRSFANAADRTAAIPSPTEGIVSYLNDVDALQVYSGSAWVSSALATGSGLVHITTSTFTTSSSETFNNVFTTAFRNYKIVVDLITSAGNNLSLKLISAGTPASTSYHYGGFRITSGASQTVTGGISGTSFLICSATGTSIVSNLTVDVLAPQIARATGILATGQGYAAGVGQYTADLNSGVHTMASSYDGFSISPGSGTFTGEISVYGYKRI